MTKNKKNILINGLGRIGKSLFRQIAGNADFIGEISINADASLDELVHKIKYDSVHGKFEKSLSHDSNFLLCDGRKISVSNARKIEDLDLKKIDLVFECTGSFNSKKTIEKYINNGVKKVIVSAPCDDANKTVIFGVNHLQITAEDLIISAGSCTTNCLAPICDVLVGSIGIEKGYMTTIHSYTNDQRVLDGSHQDPRRARACNLSIIPTKTGAATTIGKIIPPLEGKIDGSALRVPTPNVSLIDFNFIAKRNTTIEEVNNLFKSASQEGYKDIIEVAADPMVSVDFNQNTHSAIIDPFETKVIDGNFVRILAWYDNETAFAARMIDIARYIS